jgi:hypothetical protein
LEQSLEESKVVREKSYFEKKSTFYILVTTTVLIVAGILGAFILEKREPASIFISAFAIAMLWSGYNGTKQRNKRRVNSKGISS